MEGLLGSLRYCGGFVGIVQTLLTARDCLDLVEGLLGSLGSCGGFVGIIRILWKARNN